MVLNAERHWYHWENLRSYLIQIVIVAAALVGVIFIFIAWDRAYGDKPPVQVTSLDSSDLGELCSGTLVPFHNKIHIDSPTVVVYDWSTMDETLTFNYPNTASRYPALPHPVADVSFDQEIDWTVPYLPAGRYARVFSARGHETDEDPQFIWNFYTILPEEECAQ
jgi:hypothetical protein